MKFIAVLIAAILLAEGQAAEDDIILFSQGILEGLVQNNTGNITEIILCFKGIVNSNTLHLLDEQLHQAIEFLRNFDMAHWESIMKGLTLLYNMTMEVYNLAKPCISSVKEFQAIIKLLESLDPAVLIAKMTKNVVTHSPLLLKDIFGFVTAVDKKNYELAGYDTGDFIYNLMIS